LRHGCWGMDATGGSHGEITEGNVQRKSPDQVIFVVFTAPRCATNSVRLSFGYETLDQPSPLQPARRCPSKSISEIWSQVGLEKHISPILYFYKGEKVRNLASIFDCSRLRRALVSEIAREKFVKLSITQFRVVGFVEIC